MLTGNCITWPCACSSYLLYVYKHVCVSVYINIVCSCIYKHACVSVYMNMCVPVYINMFMMFMLY